MVIKLSALLCGAACLILISCASTPKPHSDSDNPVLTVPDSSSNPSENSDDEEVFTACDYVDDLTGEWEASDGTGFIYPLNTDRKSYLLYHGAWKDVTKDLTSYAEVQNISIDELWQKRYTIYSWKNPKYRKEMPLPLSDENGVEKGLKFYRSSGHIYVRDEYLITEFIFGKNLRYFLMSQDGTHFKTGKVFHLFSRVFLDMNDSDKIYWKKDSEEQNNAL